MLSLQHGAPHPGCSTSSGVPQRRRAVDWLIPLDGRKISRTGEEFRGKSRRETTFRCSPWYDKRPRVVAS